MMLDLHRPFADRQEVAISLVVDDSDKAQQTAERLRKDYDFVAFEQSDVLLVLGGDGFMLDQFRQMVVRTDSVPIYGMNTGSVGFLLNPLRFDDIVSYIVNSVSVALHPLSLELLTASGDSVKSFAFNELSLFRHSQQAAHLNIMIDGKMRLQDMICDGLVLSTAAGSTAYNFACNGPILPLGADVLALTPISVFRPRRWRGAILSNSSDICISVEDAVKRPVSAACDGEAVEHIVRVDVREDSEHYVSVLFDPDESLDERIFKEQFMA